MNHKDKINEIIEVSKKRLELKKIGLLPYAIGPTGPTARCNKSSIYIFKW